MSFALVRPIPSEARTMAGYAGMHAGYAGMHASRSSLRRVAVDARVARWNGAPGLRWHRAGPSGRGARA